ncbi:Hsp33 family molecular chaperone [Segnochrobactrum spirostomi]|uniref:Hsp33 family molecular chaperone n=1 Tax=Segnochrobactrum spirostomi TaxID=2608987 RepID=A0A6A7Y1G3_9HYPH|nr:Hsp33 family molecular chaperone [Segnochrobactrum spirostomi]
MSSPVPSSNPSDPAVKPAAIGPAPVDSVLPFSVSPLDVRGRVALLGPAVDAILKRHDYPKPVSRLLGEAIVLTAMLGTALKFEGRFTLQTATDGAVDMIVVDFETPDRIRAYARFDRDAVEAMPASEAQPERLLGQGHLALTVDQGVHMQRYQGIVALDGTTLEEVAHQYFAQSEQIPTRVRLAVGEVMSRQPGEAPSHAWRAGGVMVQFLPEAPDRIAHRDLAPGDAPGGLDDEDGIREDEDDAWVEARALVDTVEDHELTDPDLTPERLLVRLFHERGVRVYEPHPIHDRCRCSREKVESMLAQFSEEEKTDMTVDGEIVVTCEFCSSVYRFRADEV